MGATSEPNPDRLDLKPWQETLLWLIGLAAVCFVLYRFSLSSGFVMDDHEQIVSNPTLRSWHAMWQAWTKQLWFQSLAHGNYYRPLFITWSFFNFKWFATNPVGWHATAIALHVLACWGVFALARMLGFARTWAGVAAMLFAVHPVHVECVSWISATSDAMATAFYLFAFAAYIAARREEMRAVWWIVSLVLMAGAAFTKEIGATFPAMVLVYELCYRREGFGRRVVRGVAGALPFAVIAAGYIVVRSAVLHTVKPHVLAQPLGTVLLTLPSVLERYLEILAFPIGLNSFYYTPYVHGFGIGDVFVPVLTLLLVMAVLWYWYARSHNPLLPFAVAWMVITLAVTLYLPVFPPGNFVRDRYAYLPSVGFVLLLALVFSRVPDLPSAERPHLIRTGVCAAVLLFFCVTAFLQQQFWVDDLMVGYRGYVENPRNVEAEVYYAVQLGARGTNDLALLVLQRALQGPPEETSWYYDTLYRNLAIIELKMGHMEQAKAALAESKRYDQNLGTARAKELDATFYGAMGEYDKALALYQQLIAQNPNSYEAVYNYGYTFFEMGRYADAEQQFRAALALAPDMADAHHYLGETLMRLNRLGEAETELRKAITLSNDGMDYHSALALDYELEGHPAQALEEYRAELRRYPGNTAARERVKVLSGK